MDNEMELMELELDWLHEEIADHQEYAERLQETIKELRMKIALYEEMMAD